MFPNSRSVMSSRSPENSRNDDAASKGRECPFCHQIFTSSSLGRHLDLYIRPKNPKAPDGIHDLTEIRAIRGKITRRQPRSNVKKNDDGDESSDDNDAVGDVSSADYQHVPEVDSLADSSVLSNIIGPGQIDLSNKLDGQGTGVVNGGLPTYAANVDLLNKTSNNSTVNEFQSRPSTSRSGIDQVSHGSHKDVTDLAAQLALREVLDSLEAARMQSGLFSLFDFDFYSQTFPALCLQLLPSPRTLFSLQPFASPESWPLTPPGEEQLNLLRDVIVNHATAKNLDPRADDEVKRANHHLDIAYRNYMESDDSEKKRSYHLETLRALAKSQRRIDEKTAELKLLRQRADFYRMQYDRAIKRLNPCEAYLLAASNPMPLSSDEQTQLDIMTPEARSWNYDQLISKWRVKLRESKKTDNISNQHIQKATDTINELQTQTSETQVDNPAAQGRVAPLLRFDGPVNARYFFEDNSDHPVRRSNNQSYERSEVQTSTDGQINSQGKRLRPPSWPNDI